MSKMIGVGDSGLGSYGDMLCVWLMLPAMELRWFNVILCDSKHSVLFVKILCGECLFSAFLHRGNVCCCK